MRKKLNSPCPSVSDSDHAYIVEYYVQDLYGANPLMGPTIPGAIASPGHTKRIGKCAILLAKARGDAASLLAAARALKPGSGRNHSI